VIVRGGTLVTADGLVRADLATDGEQISEIAAELPGGGEEIDARGMMVLPGLIDAHVHFNEPGRADWEGSATGSRALAAGGGTVFFDMPLNSTPCTLTKDLFRSKHEALAGTSVTDFGLWGGIVPGNRDELAGLAEAGVIGYKAFMADSGLPEFPRADDRTLYEGMRVAAEFGLTVAVHAENNDLVTHQGSGTGVRDFLESRPVLAEVEAIQRAALLARETGAKLHIVHISSWRGIRAALEARKLGTDISIETCPHYLYFTDEDMVRMGPVAKCAPPLRPAEDRDDLRGAVLLGHVDIIGSDHSPAPLSMKCQENFFEVWGGIAGVQSTLAVLMNLPGLMLPRIAKMTAGNPASRFRVARKGNLAVGYDADFCIVDPNRSYTVTRESLFQRHGLSPYVGSTFRGEVRRTVLRGQTIFQDGKIAGAPRGKMILHAKTGTYA
jgi:allantoinase